MSRQLDFFYDYGSPYSYVANAQLPAVVARTGAMLVYRPMLLGGVFKATGNRSPAAEPIEPKRRYGGITLLRYAAEAGVAFRMNPHFPIDTLFVMRCAVAAQRARVFDAFHARVYPAFWAEGENLGDRDALARVLASAGLDAASLFEGAQAPEVKSELRANTEEAVARGAFGAPTFFVGDELFFGSDHLRFAAKALEALPR
ncbi:MAG TPA: 2-hydroxychromene-2-carboxylate isomerase [Myxococcota bacterium]|jgi:2-hydroxychromene-2-carboxylate isomerase|nr:2-hydroxychromene-2-carboxylate isomerase [Myxococcota bacterium]